MFTSVKQQIRRDTIATVLDYYDHSIRNLTETARREKYDKMSTSPFSFFRGSSHLFYYDFAKVPLAFDTSEAYPTFIQGDLHFENFGVFGDGAGTIIYDVNDFDEAYLGSYLFDVLRMAISVDLFAAESGFDSNEAIEVYAETYALAIRRYAKGKDEDVQFTKANTSKAIKKVIKKAEKKQDAFMSERTEVRDEERYFATSDDLIPVSEKTATKIKQAWPEYLNSLSGEYRHHADHYDIKDIAIKRESGTASIGLERYYILIEGADEEHDEDVILEMKQAQSAVPSLFLPTHPLFEDGLSHEGARVIAAQRAMVHSQDPYLGYFTIDGNEYYVRQRSPYKRKVKAKHIKNESSLIETLKVQAEITAKIHARADADANVLEYEASEQIAEAIGDALPLFVRQISRWARFYANQVRFDFEAFHSWVETRSESD
ncbi:DUF2252 domain-containing protein [Exiguobacterium sp. SH1S21]|uniref:DUF2252 domain-containing protein n=1 Tax=Exiguobacterium sp. SH1S21 TaxID=2510953 RepID=UPI001038A731|nr:DUF2252 family protein [Exiguobacterium sp. SH1S21]TCI57708.1 DUF2252 domain-containing protein [Exiguobacterium sp. SH1S21]